MQHKPYGPYERYVKRPQDFFCALAAIIVLSPVMAATAIMVRKKLGSPILFKQDRPGKDGKLFKVYKFRSMTSEMDENGVLLPDEVRLTQFGKSLRATSLDELPENHAFSEQVLLPGVIIQSLRPHPRGERLVLPVLEEGLLSVFHSSGP